MHTICLSVQVLGRRKPFFTWCFESTAVLFRARSSDTLRLAWVRVYLNGDFGGVVAELGIVDAELYHLEMKPTLESVKRNKKICF